MTVSTPHTPHTVTTVADVVRFILDWRKIGEVPDGVRSAVEPDKPEQIGRQPARPYTAEDREAYPALRAAWDAEKAAYDTSYRAWQEWHSMGRRFVGYGGPHRQTAYVDPSDLYPIVMVVLKVSESKAKSLTRAAFEAGEVIRHGSGSSVSYTVPEVIDAREEAFEQQDERLRVLADRARDVGLDVEFHFRHTGSFSTASKQVVDLSLSTPLERVIEILEGR